jgi:hypothetical protein
MAHYTTLDTIKQKLRITDTSIDDELDIYIDEVDNYINRKIRRRIGEVNQYGYPIVLPLTDETQPAITYDLRSIAADLVEGKFRLKTTNDQILWQNADKELDEYIDTRFGWAEGNNLRLQPTLTISPTTGSAGSTVTLSGTGWKPRGEIYVKIVDNNDNHQTMSTSPSAVLTDDSGNWSAVTITVPSTTSVSSIRVLVHDKVNSLSKNFTVTS